ncbi:MAG: hypothetical protein QM731_04500 [Chitinophagaceae bacterium]
MKRNTFDPRKIIFLGTYRKMLVFYFWQERYCVRTVSSLSGKRVKRSAKFRLTMQYAERLGRASKIASRVYRQLPDGWKLHSLYRKMTGLGSQLLREREYTATEIEMALWQYLAGIGFKAEEHGMLHPMPVAVQQVPAQSVKLVLFPLPVLHSAITKVLLGKGSVLAKRRKEQESRFSLVQNGIRFKGMRKEYRL